MLKRSSSSSSATHRKYPPSPPSQAPVEVSGRRKKLVDARNPLQDLNGDVSSSNASSYSSIEAPSGCLRFFLSHSSSTRNKSPNRSKTPKSSPAPQIRNPRYRKRPIECEKVELMNRMQGHELGQINCASNLTPAAKLTTELGFEQQGKVNKVQEEKSGDSKIKTPPPLQPSVSPEIQCGSNVMEKRPTCYGTGHLLSGVPDKRKCWPKGVLCLRNKGSIFDIEEEEDIGIDKRSGLSPVLLPQEASVRWFSSPCDEQKFDKFEDSPSLCLSSPVSCRTSPTFTSDLCKKINGSCGSNSTMDTSSSSSSMRNNSGLCPSKGHLDDLQGLFGSVSGCDISSPIQTTPSNVDAPFMISPLLSSGNIIQTPSSDSNADRHDCFRFSSGLYSEKPEEHRSDSELDSVTNVFDKVALSPELNLSLWDPPYLSFRLDDCLNNTPCNSIDLAHVQRVLDCKESWISDSTVSAFTSQSPLWISWRDGLVGRIIEMDDEDDMCRCLSDDEEDHPIERLLSKVPNSRSPPELVDNKPEKEDDKELDLHVECAYRESMSFDGDRLKESSDSDWNLCYKNELFRD